MDNGNGQPKVKAEEEIFFYIEITSIRCTTSDYSFCDALIGGKKERKIAPRAEEEMIKYQNET